MSIHRHCGFLFKITIVSLSANRHTLPPQILKRGFFIFVYNPTHTSRIQPQKLFSIHIIFFEFIYILMFVTYESLSFVVISELTCCWVIFCFTNDCGLLFTPFEPTKKMDWYIVHLKGVAVLLLQSRHLGCPWHLANSYIVSVSLVLALGKLCYDYLSILIVVQLSVAWFLTS